MLDSRLHAPRTPARVAVAAALGLLAALASCGGAPPPAATPAAPAHQDPGSAPRDAAAGEAGGTEGAPAPARAGDPAGPHQAGPVTEAECRALLVHVVAIANQAHAETVDPELAPTEEQLADIRARMAPEFLPMCLALDRATFECEMRASTRDELLACEP